MLSAFEYVITHIHTYTVYFHKQLLPTDLLHSGSWAWRMLLKAISPPEHIESQEGVPQ